MPNKTTEMPKKTTEMPKKTTEMLKKTTFSAEMPKKTTFCDLSALKFAKYVGTVEITRDCSEKKYFDWKIFFGTKESYTRTKKCWENFWGKKPMEIPKDSVMSDLLRYI